MKNNLKHFHHQLSWTMGLLGLLAVTFLVYAWSEKRIDQANDMRHQSFLLADELRQSSDDLTRMARTYVITGDVRYKLAYQAILDIRNGKQPRPGGYQNVYWDTVLTSSHKPPVGDGPSVPMLTLMRQAGFTEQELAKLELAKANSDRLTVTEAIAMGLVENAAIESAAVHAEANAMMHDEQYHRDKAAIMQPIKEFNTLIDQRTYEAVTLAQSLALLLRVVFISFALSLVVVVMRAKKLLHATLGGSAEAVFTHFARIGQGDFDTPIDVTTENQSSVLGSLAKTQLSLKQVFAERELALAKITESELHLRSIIEADPECIKMVDPQGCLLQMNPAGLAMVEADSFAQVAGRPVLGLIAPEYQSAFEQMHRRVIGGEPVELAFEVQGLKGGRRHLETHAVPLQFQGKTVHLAVTRDITEQKKAEEATRIAATAFELQQGILITNAQRVILRVNKMFIATTGYSAEDAVGQNPRMLASGRHDRAYYAAMTGELETSGAWQGEIWNKRKNGEVYPEWLSISAVKDEAGLTTHYVGTFTDISERVKAQAQIDTLAFYDPLTNLPNRRLLLDRLDQALHVSTRHDRRNALLFVDLDNFKTLNDTLGHFQGDALLVQVAQRLKTCIREGDTVARLGSDEFVVMLKDLSEDDIESATQAETVSEKILEAFIPEFSLDSGMHRSTPSIGITLFGGKTPESSEQPLKRAELAMFQAKACGRNTLRFFDTRMQAMVSAHAALEADLREAVAKQQFLLHYQPQVVGAGSITGVEALIRWQHPQRGIVSPAEFIPLAEESGLILPIGHWVLETACQQLAAWATQPDFAHLTMAVNVSARQFKQSDFVDNVLATMARTRATPKLLKLELTESMLVDDVEAIISKMGVLKSHGICFSLDDFGTGYSSLSYLKRLPLDQLKIDQGFIRNIVADSNDSAIAKMVVVLAESLGLSVIAEGVELQAQADFLAHLGCRAYQGYLFSRPLPLVAFEMLVRQVSSHG